MVSIILPVFNAERFLPQCLYSILRQTYQNWELIAVDDGSKDGSMEILKSYEKRDNRIHIISKENEGVSIARNVALLLSIALTKIIKASGITISSESTK